MLSNYEFLLCHFWYNLMRIYPLRCIIIWIFLILFSFKNYFWNLHYVFFISLILYFNYLISIFLLLSTPALPHADTCTSSLTCMGGKCHTFSFSSNPVCVLKQSLTSCSGWPWTYTVVLLGLELVIFLPQPPKELKLENCTTRHSWLDFYF